MANDVEVPHFTTPFRWGSSGHVEIVEQDSDDDVFQCVEAIVRTPKGSRLELPDFGVPDLTFKEGGPTIEPVASAIQQYEPRAQTFIDLSDPADLEPFMSQINIGVGNNP